MSMRLVCNNIQFETPFGTIVLKPSLRAAYSLVSEYGDLQIVLSGILDGNLSVMTTVVRHAAISEKALSYFMQTATQNGIAYLQPFKLKFIELIAAFVRNGTNSEDSKISNNNQKTDNSKQEPIDAFYVRLFKIGTGTLGWTPEQTWQASPQEIILAADGRHELISSILKAVFGSPDAKESAVTQYSDEEIEQIIEDGKDKNFDRSAFEDLRLSL